MKQEGERQLAPTASSTHMGGARRDVLASQFPKPATSIGSHFLRDSTLDPSIQPFAQPQSID